MQDSTEKNFQNQDELNFFVKNQSLELEKKKNPQEKIQKEGIKDEIKLLEEKVEKMPRCSEHELYALKLTFLNFKRSDYEEFIDNAIECLEEENLMNPHFRGVFVKMRFFLRDNNWEKMIAECDYLINEFRIEKLKKMRDIIIQTDYRHQIEFKEETYENSFNFCKNLLIKQLTFFLQHQEDTLKKDFQTKKDDINDISKNLEIFVMNKDWIKACLGTEAKIWHEQFTSNLLKHVERLKNIIENALNTDIRSKLLKSFIEEVDLIQYHFRNLDWQINESCEFIKAKIKSFMESKVSMLAAEECQY